MASLAARSSLRSLAARARAPAPVPIGRCMSSSACLHATPRHAVQDLRPAPRGREGKPRPREIPLGDLLPADGDGAAGGPPRPDDEASSVPRPAHLTVVSTEEILLVAGLLDNVEDDQAATKENVTVISRFRPLPLPLRLVRLLFKMDLRVDFGFFLFLSSVWHEARERFGWGRRSRGTPMGTRSRGASRVPTSVMLTADLQQHQPHYIISVPLVYETLYSSIQRQISASSRARKTVALALTRISLLFMEAKQIYEV
ncbi:hypothetical protein ZWY2020_048765 [Hordeum vulgare]|nr:hypothetical protein ZWY2020_048765 [Hordeum vulgare]